MTEVRVNRKAEARWASGHPWIFRDDLITTGAEPGSAVSVLSERGRLLGTAHYSSASKIALRRLDARAIPIDAAFFEARLRAALAHRDRVVRDSDSFRLVHGEADFLPGLVIDWYAGCAVAQFLSQGMHHATPAILEALRTVMAPRVVVARNDAAARTLEGLPRDKAVLEGSLDSPVEARFQGMVWRVDPLEGQKTGVFLDQRENYAAAAKYAHGPALDCFTCTGGFALHLAKSCDSVEAVDSSESALATASANAAANGVNNVRFKEADALNLLAAYSSARRSFGTVVLDPPAFAKNRQSVEAALRAYRDINTRALRLLASGGVLVTCSCSHHVSEADLLEVVARAALDAGRTLRVLERRVQSADHPVLLAVPETLYLKCVILQVC